MVVGDRDGVGDSVKREARGTLHHLIREPGTHSTGPATDFYVVGLKNDDLDFHSGMTST